MGTGRKLGYALGQGLVTLGNEMGKIEAQKQERARYEAELQRKEELQDANLKSMDIRNEQLKLANNLKKVQLNNNRIATVFAQTDGDAAAMSQVITQHGNGYVELFDEAESARLTKQNGFETIVTNQGVYKTNEKGDIVNGENGKPIFEPLPGAAAQTIRTRPEYNQHVGNVLNPDKAVARANADMSYAEKYKEAEIQHKAKEASLARREQTPQGKRKARLEEAQIAAAGRRGTDTPKPPAATVTGVGGNKIKRTHQESAGDQASFKVMAKQNPEWGVTSPDEAFRINQLKNEPKLRSALADDIKKGLNDPEYAQRFIEVGSEKMGVPVTFLQDLFDRVAMEKEISGKKKGGIKNWLKKFFSGTEGQAAPTAFPKKQPAGGLS